MHRDDKMRKFLVKSSKNGRYIKSKLILTNDVNINTNSNTEFLNENTYQTSINNNSLSCSQNKADYLVNNIEVINSNEIINTLNEDKKDKLMKTLIQNSDILKSDNNTTIMINSESLSNILEKNSVTVRWCKLCNIIVL